MSYFLKAKKLVLSRFKITFKVLEIHFNLINNLQLINNNNITKNIYNK